MTDDQIARIIEAQQKVMKQATKQENPKVPGTDEPVASPTDPFVKAGPQWDILKSKGWSDERAEAFIRKMRGE